MKIRSVLQQHRTGFWPAAGLLLCVCGAGLAPGLRAAAQQEGQRTRGAQAPAGSQQSTPDPEHGGAEPPPVGGAGRGGGFGIVAYPDRPTAPKEVLDRGKAIYSVNCSFCHGSDAGGGSVGPNLHRSEIVLQDKNGELLLPIVQGALISKGM